MVAVLVELACGLRQYCHRLVEALPLSDEVRVGKLSDLPYADDQMLDTLPLPQVWPSLGNALEMANQAAAAAQSAQQSMVVSRR